jgi:hypothetical protein
MSITVYYSFNSYPRDQDYNPFFSSNLDGSDFLNLSFLEPDLVIKEMPVLNDKENDIRQCPAVKDELRNLYTFKSPLAYELDIGKDIKSHMYNQKVFNNFFHVRYSNPFLISLYLPIVFYSEDMLEISQCNAFFHDNEFVNNVNVIQGRYNISKWFRYLDLSFLVKRNKTKIVFDIGDVLYYIKFHTNEKINLQYFNTTREIFALSKACTQIKFFSHLKKPFHGLKYYYSMFEQSLIKKRILKEIKNNLVR